MSRIFWNTFKVAPAIAASLLIASNSLAAESVTEQTATVPTEETTIAQTSPVSSEVPADTNNIEQLQRYNSEISGEDGMSQVTNVSQFRDVQPSDWAYEALSRVVQTYGCLQGYPDGTYRGNRALSRYEFAAGLNACLRQIEALIGRTPTPGGGGVSDSDLQTLRRLTEEFRTELTTLGTRVNNLEGRTAFIEQRQFSTTTKLVGEVVIAASEVFGKSGPTTNGQTADNVEPILSNRVRLNLDTSFTGKDRLRTRLQARNTVPFSGALTGTNMTRLGFDGDNQNDIEIHRLEYRFPVTPNANIFLSATGTEYNDIIYTFNPLLESAASGSISRFGRFNPIYRTSAEGASAVLDYKLSKQVGLSLGYAVPRNIANRPETDTPTQPGLSLFNGSYAALAQLAFRPSNAVGLGLTYVRSFSNPPPNPNPSGLGAIGAIGVSSGTGSAFANQPFGANTPTTTNQYGVEASFRLSPRFVVSGWAGYTQAEAAGDTGIARLGSSADIWNYAVTLALPDFGKQGNVLGFVFGMPPKVTQNEVTTRQDNRGTSYHVEGFYRYRLTDNVEITPGVFAILNPQHNDNNDTLYVGTLRTTFRF
ncbi:cyanobacterial porin [Crinalium epipsammum PCC 9333]|uniref:Cyanobacterial porin n=1 Tax=Crinalium epipsammum PCC 9333 TaxID=1173022 RepID=K9W345_9CYAN|nr:iron uptake porin [Crinalium epipsammum]AFZ14788.1 cyanobacterial porin [Crinalium epipsammum PCC 9333]